MKADEALGAFAKKKILRAPPRALNPMDIRPVFTEVDLCARGIPA
jgi:hypothetical protein